MLKTIEVNYKVYSTDYTIKKALKLLDNHKVISYDCETNTLFSKENRAEAKDLLKNSNLNYKDMKFCKLVARSSGLSNPRLIKVTHFLFGTSKDESIILIANSRKTEKLIFDWLANYKGKVITWNALFDLKIMYDRVNKLPRDYEDAMLLLKSLINDVNDWEGRVGLKDFMGKWYDKKWQLIETYDIENFKDKDFLRYCSIDAASTYYAYEIIKEEINGK